MEKTLASLFDGIGGFPLAGYYSGFSALWASEIEKFPIEVTKIRFPDMKHLGDITKIKGAEVSPTAVVAGGSPCQDMSIAGKRTGLAGERSGLFMEQIRVIKEMRDADAKRGRTDDLIRPRYMLWENVPGAFSSNDGEDFRTVLEETCRIADSTISVPGPPSGAWDTVGAVMGTDFSLAWRVLDAQYWGVPQRRRRIFLVADFAGFTAPEILFKPESLSGDFTQGGAERKGTAGGIKKSAGTSGTDYLTGWDNQEKRIFSSSGVSPTLSGSDGGGGRTGCGYIAIPINDKATRYSGGGPSRNEDGSGNGLGIGQPGDPAPTLSCGDRHAVAVSAGFCGKAGAKAGNIGYEKETAPTLQAGQESHVLCYDARGNGDGSTAATLTGDHEGRITDYTSLAVFSQQRIGQYVENEVGSTQTAHQCKDNTDLILEREVAGVDCRNACENEELCATLQAKPGGGFSYNCIHPVRIGCVVRRLTPLECERIQGYPDGWTDIPGASDNVRYKALGNSIAVPCVAYIMRGLAEQLEKI